MTHDGHTFVDHYGRDAATCRTQAEHARAQRDALERAKEAATDGSLVLGREAGQRFVRRLVVDAEAFGRLVERDLLLADELAAADASANQLVSEIATVDPRDAGRLRELRLDARRRGIGREALDTLLERAGLAQHTSEAENRRRAAALLNRLASTEGRAA